MGVGLKDKQRQKNVARLVFKLSREWGLFLAPPLRAFSCGGCVTCTSGVVGETGAGTTVGLSFENLKKE